MTAGKPTKLYWSNPDNDVRIQAKRKSKIPTSLTETRKISAKNVSPLTKSDVRNVCNVKKINSVQIQNTNRKQYFKKTSTPEPNDNRRQMHDYSYRRASSISSDDKAKTRLPYGGSTSKEGGIMSKFGRKLESKIKRPISCKSNEPHPNPSRDQSYKNNYSNKKEGLSCVAGKNKSLKSESCSDSSKYGFHMGKTARALPDKLHISADRVKKITLVGKPASSDSFYSIGEKPGPFKVLRNQVTRDNVENPGDAHLPPTNKLPRGNRLDRTGDKGNISDRSSNKSSTDASLLSGSVDGKVKASSSKTYSDYEIEKNIEIVKDIIIENEQTEVNFTKQSALGPQEPDAKNIDLGVKQNDLRLRDISNLHKKPDGPAHAQISINPQAQIQIPAHTQNKTSEIKFKEDRKISELQTKDSDLKSKEEDTKMKQKELELKVKEARPNTQAQFDQIICTRTGKNPFLEASQYKPSAASSTSDKKLPKESSFADVLDSKYGLYKATTIENLLRLSAKPSEAKESSDRKTASILGTEAGFGRAKKHLFDSEKGDKVIKGTSFDFFKRYNNVAFVGNTQETINGLPNTVTLYQPPDDQLLLYDIANCAATQVYLKLCKVDFKVVYKTNAEQMSPSGRVPFIRCGNCIISEFEPIVAFVNAKFATCTEVKETDRPPMRAFMAIVNGVLDNAERFICWYDETTLKEHSKPRTSAPYPFPLGHIISWKKKYEERKRLSLQNRPEKPFEEILKEMRTLCKHLSQRLDNRKCFFGNSYCEFDALVYGHIYALLSTSLRGPAMTMRRVLKQLPNLITFAKEMDQACKVKMFSASDFEDM